jgi:hypothetical protein
MPKWLILIFLMPFVVATCVGGAAQMAVPIYTGSGFPVATDPAQKTFTPDQIGQGADVSLILPTGIGNDCERLYVAKNYSYALQVQRVSGLPSGLIPDLLAIPLHEQGCTTQWPGNNGYGIKCFDHPPCFSSATWEEKDGRRVNINDSFRSFDSPAGSMLGFVQFLEDNSRYAQAISTFKASGDPDDLIRGIAAAGYATNSQWAQEVIPFRKRVSTLIASATIDTRVAIGGTCVSSPSKPDNLRASLIDDFGILMNGFDATHLSWAWEQLCKASGTRFNQLTKGATIVATTAVISQQVGCAGATSVYLGPFTPKETFQFIMTHELGHFIYNCHRSDGLAHNADFVTAHNTEGGVSFYANNAKACTGPESDNLSEDAADTVAYYLHPGSNIQTVLCAGTRAGPNLQASYKLHYNWGLEVLGPMGDLVPVGSPIAFILGGLIR